MGVNGHKVPVGGDAQPLILPLILNTFKLIISGANDAPPQLNGGNGTGEGNQHLPPHGGSPFWIRTQVGGPLTHRPLNEGFNPLWWET